MEVSGDTVRSGGGHVQKGRSAEFVARRCEGGVGYAAGRAKARPYMRVGGDVLWRGNLVRLLRMLFMVIERFRNGDARTIGERFRSKGRMMPENVKYVASWVDGRAMRCFQLMEAPSSEAMQPWVKAWEDLVEFEIVAVETSQEFWERLAREQG